MIPPFLSTHTAAGSDVLAVNPPGGIRHHQQDNTGDILRVAGNPVRPRGEGELLANLVPKVTIGEPTAGVRGGGPRGNRVDRDAVAGAELRLKSCQNDSQPELQWWKLNKTHTSAAKACVRYSCAALLAP